MANLKPFQPGNKIGLGNKNAAKSLQYKRILREQVTEDKWREIVQRAMDQAMEGDKDARKWLSDILISKNVRMAGGASLKLSGEDAQKQIDLLFGLVASVSHEDPAEE